MSLEFTGEVIRQANVYGQIVEYHQVVHKRSANHIDNAPSAVLLQSQANMELRNRSVDGWCEEAVIVQHVLTDDIYFSCYVAATEQVSPQIIIPAWVVAVVVIALAAAAMFLGWLAYTAYMATLEKALPTSYYRTKDGERTSSFTEYVTLQRQYCWLVCPKCGMGFADKNDYPTWEQIPQDVHDAYEEHVANCQGITPPPSYPWLVPVLIFGAVVIVVGSVWAVSQIFIRQEAPPITIYR